MELERIRMDKKMILGIPYRGENKADAVSDLWDQFFERVTQLSDFEPGTDFYALSEPIKDGRLHYLVGIEVESVQEIPEGMEIWYLRHEDYVVYAHKGGKESVPASFSYIYSTLLPEAGFKPSEDYDFEVYTPHYYERDEEDSIVYLCVPVLSEAEAGLSTDYTVLRDELIPKGMEPMEEPDEQGLVADKKKREFTFLEDDEIFPAEVPPKGLGEEVIESEEPEEERDDALALSEEERFPMDMPSEELAQDMLDEEERHSVVKGSIDGIEEEAAPLETNEDVSENVEEFTDIDEEEWVMQEFDVREVEDSEEEIPVE